MSLFFGHGILGMNARNLLYIKKYNPKSWVRLADNKLKTKRYLGERGIPFAETYATIRNLSELRSWEYTAIQKNCVIKPNEWSKGNGILVLDYDEKGFFDSDHRYSEDELRTHMEDILDGAFSITNSHDAVLIEEKLVPGNSFKHFCQYGLADIRIIVFNLVPIAAMVRMPTKTSGWKANLGQWGIGFWVDIATGEIHTFFQNRTIFHDTFPEKYRFLQGKIIDHWDDILLYSSQIQIFTKLKYLALDWVITPDGPKLLEINARAGLEVQNVNGIGLRDRLNKVEKLKVTDPLKWREIAQSLFHETPMFHIQQKDIIYTQQRGILTINEKTKIPVEIIPNIQQKISTASPDINLENNPISITTTDGAHIKTSFVSDKTLPKWTILLWTDSLQGLYINPNTSPTYQSSIIGSQWDPIIAKIDQDIFLIHKQLNLSALLKPTNYYQEMDIFIAKNGEYNPVFTYDFPEKYLLKQLRNNIQNIRSQLKQIPPLYHGLQMLFSEKLDELYGRIELITWFVEERGERIERANTLLFWPRREATMILAEEAVQNWHTTLKNQRKLQWDLLMLPEIMKKIEEYTKEQWLALPIIRIRENAWARMSISYGKKIRINISRAAQIYSAELPAILAHEIGVHMRRSLSGHQSGLKILEYWTGFYLLDEEWLAIYESLKYLPKWYKKDAMYLKYYLCYEAEKTDFIWLAKLVRSFYPNKSQEQIFSDTHRIKRGISHTSHTHMQWYMKDTIYLQWYLKVRNWIEEGGDPYPLFQGKIKIEDISLIKDLLTF